MRNPSAVKRTKLLVVERASLITLEAVIERGLASFIDVGNALLEIRDSRLYRESHTTFEDYCRQRWSMSKTHANRLLVASETVMALTPMGVTPTTERQARELAPVLREEGAEAAGEVWQEAVDRSGGEPPTAAVVREVRTELGRAPTERVRPVQELAVRSEAEKPAVKQRKYVNSHAREWNEIRAVIRDRLLPLEPADVAAALLGDDFAAARWTVAELTSWLERFTEEIDERKKHGNRRKDNG